MTPVEHALQEPHLWTRVAIDAPDTVVRHPNGTHFIMKSWTTNWVICLCPDVLDPIARTENHLATVARIDPGPDACIRDAIQAMGVDARGQMEQLLNDITGWMLSSPDLKGAPYLDRNQGEVYFTGDWDILALPGPLHDRLDALEHVAWPGGHTGLLDCTANIPLHVPQTEHGKMALRARAASLPVA